MIIELTTNTFDFWFKIYNTILLFVTTYVRYYIDAIPTTINFKRIATILFVIVMGYEGRGHGSLFFCSRLSMESISKFSIYTNKF